MMTSHLSLHDGSALIAQEESQAFIAKAPYNKAKKGRPYCDHCKKSGHTRETCWEIHGKPANWKPSRYSKDQDTQANAAATSPFSPEQLEMLSCLIRKATQPADSSPASTGLMAQRGTLTQAIKALTAFHVTTSLSSMWITDSGASDHMTSNHNLFYNYTPSDECLYVTIADGSKTLVAGSGSVKVSPQLTLKSVLHVPQLHCNLLSVHKVIKDSCCLTIF